MYIRKSTRVTVLALARNGEGRGGGVLETEDEEGGSAEVSGSLHLSIRTYAAASVRLIASRQRTHNEHCLKDPSSQTEPVEGDIHLPNAIELSQPHLLHHSLIRTDLKLRSQRSI